MGSEVQYREMIEASEWNRTVPTWADNTFSMMQRHERAMLWHLTKSFPRPIGCIVDAGCWTGASTLAFCRGLRDGNHPLSDNMVAAFDLFRVDDHARNIYLQRKGLDLEIGDSLLPVFFENIRGHDRLVSVIKGDLLDFRWNGRSIDILFLDLLKTRDLNRHGSEIFFPSLTRGSIIIQQDYVFDHLPWIPMTMHMFRENFTAIGYCDSSAIFHVDKVPNEDEVREKLAEMDDLPLEEKLGMFDHIANSMQHPVQRAQLRLSRLWCALRYGDPDRAMREQKRFPQESLLPWVPQKLKLLESAIAKAS